MNRITPSTFAGHFCGPTRTYTETRLELDLKNISEVEKSMREALKTRNLSLGIDDDGNPLYESSRQYLDLYLEHASSIFWRRSHPTRA